MARPPIPKSPAPPVAPNDPVRNPPSADSLRLGTTVAVIAHVGLIAALAYGVAWKRQEIATVTAELWSAVPQQAAPAAPPPAPAPRVKAEPVPPPPAPEPPAPVVKPPPAPRDADIAREKADKRRREAEAEAEKAEQEKKLAKLEQAKREKAEKAEKAAKEKEKEKEAERKAADKAAAAEKTKELAKEAAQQEKSAKAREDNLKRLQKQLGEGSDDAAPATRPAATTGTAGGGTAARSSAPSAGYAGRVLAYLKPKLVYTGRDFGQTATVRVRVTPDGTIISRELISSSGNPEWDQAVLKAFDRAGVLPRDTDNRIPPVFDISWTAER